MIRIKTGFLFCILAFVSFAYAEIAIGDTFAIHAGYSDNTGMSGGATDATEILDSILIKSDTTLYIFKIIKTATGGFFEMGGTMTPLITSNPAKLVVLGNTPSNITSCSSRFKNVKWIIGKQSDVLFCP